MLRYQYWKASEAGCSHHIDGPHTLILFELATTTVLAQNEYSVRSLDGKLRADSSPLQDVPAVYVDRRQIGDAHGIVDTACSSLAVLPRPTRRDHMDALDEIRLAPME